VPKGSVRIGVTESNSSNIIYAFYHQASGRVTIVGQNSGGTNDTISTNLANLPSVPSFQFYQTTNTVNLQRGADIAVTNNTFSFTAPANSVYTLTYAPSSPTPPPPAPTPTPPPPSPTPPPPSPTPAPTPTPPPPVIKQGDINGDNAVNIFDLSILLSNYGKTRAQASNPVADLNNNNTVDIFDLSILLSRYGT